MEDKNWLPEGWIETKLHDVTVLRNEKVDPLTIKKPIPYLSLEHIESNTNRITNHGMSNDVKSSKSLFRSGDVLYGKLRPYLNKVCQPEFDGVCSTDILVFEPSRAVDNRFLLGLLSRRETTTYANRNSKGINLPRISPQKLGEMQIKLPPLNEQQRIVAKTEELQELSRQAREALETVPDLLEQFRQSILAAAFRGDLTRKWREQNPDVEPATELLKRIRTERRTRWEAVELEKLKAKGLNGDKLDVQFARQRKKYKEPEPVDTRGLPVLPKGWVWVSAECVVPADEPIVYGIILPGPHIDDGIPYIRPLEIQDDIIVNEPIPKTSPEIAAKYRRAKLSTGDIVLSIVGTLGKVAIVPERLNGANITQSSARLKPWVDFISSDYLGEVLRSPILRKQYEILRFGNAVQRLNIAHVRSLTIPLPPKKEQEEIIKGVQHRAGVSDTFFSSVETCLEKLDSLESNVSYRAFRGELVSQDPNDEPASILLERIREEKVRRVAEEESKPKKRGRKMKSPKAERKDILTILQEAVRPMTPEDVFTAGGFGEDSVDAFYEKLRSLSKKIREVRKGAEVYLEAIP